MLEETQLYSTLRRVATGPTDDFVWISSFDYALKTEILNLIRNDQLTNEGIDEAGRIIGYYSFLTEIISGGAKKEGDPYDLNDSGSFYSSIFVQVFKDSFVIDAASSTFEEMKTQDWYSDGILGLTDENLQKVIQEIGNRYSKQMEQLLFGTS
jgi:hypothetical protein